MRHLIAICGARRSGKDTICKRAAEMHGYKHMKISQPLKDAIKILFGFTNEQMETDEKEQPDPNWNISPRQVMQYVGTDVFQYDIQAQIPGIGREFWVRSFYQSMLQQPETSNIILSDLRFMHEYQFFKNKGIHISVIKVVRGASSTVYDDAVDGHISEKEFHIIPYDAVIMNDSSIEALDQSVDEIINRMKPVSIL